MIVVPSRFPEADLGQEGLGRYGLGVTTAARLLQ
jgi:hypothetical protein